MRQLEVCIIQKERKLGTVIKDVITFLEKSRFSWSERSEIDQCQNTG